MEECGPCPVFASFSLAFALKLREKHGKTSVRLKKNLSEDKKTSVRVRKTSVRVRKTSVRVRKTSVRVRKTSVRVRKTSVRVQYKPEYSMVRVHYYMSLQTYTQWGRGGVAPPSSLNMNP